MKLKKSFYLFFFVLIFFSCSTTGNLEKTQDDLLCPPCPKWQPIQEGFSKLEYQIQNLDVYCCIVKIDLSTPGLNIQLCPHHPEEITSTFTISQFATQTSSVVAMNTTPFDTENCPLGITQIDGKQITPPSSKYAALLLKKDDQGYKAQILQQDSLPPAQEGSWIIGGYFQILQEGQSKTYFKSRRSRTAAGISGDGSTLYLMIAVPVFSPTDNNGLTYDECSQILLELGCQNALTFDGGHSTAMAIQGKTQKQPLFPREICCAMGFSIQP